MFEVLEKYKSLDFFAKQIVEGYITGLHRSPFHGFSVEFAEHRQYHTGESTRNIDWKLYGRTDKLFVKRYEEETNLRCQLVIDHSSSMLYPLQQHGNLQQPNKLTFSVYAAATLIELLVRQRDAFGLSLLSDKIDLQTEIRSNATHQKYLYGLLEQEMTDATAKNLPQRKTSIAESLHLTAEQLHRSSMVVVFTDTMVGQNEWDALFDALRHLRHNKHEVLLFHTLVASHELRFEFDNRPTEFIDLESSRRLKVQPSEVAVQYSSAMKQKTEEIRRRAMQYRIDYVAVDVEKGFEQVMLPFLLKRGKKN